MHRAKHSLTFKLASEHCLSDNLWGGFFFLLAKRIKLGENLYDCK